MAEPQDDKAPELDPLSAQGEALVDRAERAAADARAEAASLSQEMEERLARLESRAKSGKASFDRAAVRPKEESKSTSVVGRGLAVGLAVAYSIIGLPLAGFALGWFIESQGGAPGWVAGLGIGGAVVGVAHGAWLAQRLQK
jgi:hypothetical protein